MVRALSDGERNYYASAAETVGTIYSGNIPLGQIPPELVEWCVQELLTAFEPTGPEFRVIPGTTPNDIRTWAIYIGMRQALNEGSAVIGPLVPRSEARLCIITGAAAIWLLRPEFTET